MGESSCSTGKQELALLRSYLTESETVNKLREFSMVSTVSYFIETIDVDNEAN